MSSASAPVGTKFIFRRPFYYLDEKKIHEADALFQRLISAVIPMDSPVVRVGNMEYNSVVLVNETSKAITIRVGFVWQFYIFSVSRKPTSTHASDSPREAEHRDLKLFDQAFVTLSALDLASLEGRHEVLDIMHRFARFLAGYLIAPRKYRFPSQYYIPHPAHADTTQKSSPMARPSPGWASPTMRPFAYPQLEVLTQARIRTDTRPYRNAVSNETATNVS